jgi:hypothetical protein
MKHVYRSPLGKVILLSIAITTCFLINACQKPTQGISIIVNSNILFPAPTVIKFANADSTSANKLTSFPVTISGPGAAYVQMSSGGTNFQVTNGIMSIALTKGANPSVANPISFTVTASLNGFAPIVQNITLTEDKLSVYNIKAVEYAQPAAGTTVLVQSAPVVNSAMISSTYVVTTPTTPTMTEQATVKFDAGTQLQDINGSPISAGSLNINIVQYGTGNSASLAALPGGTNTTTLVNSSGNAINGSVNFVTAGLLQMNVDVASTPVKKFSKPVSISMELNSNQVNFSTGKLIKVGDVIPYWSLNETTGQWKSEGTSTVVLDANGKLSIPMQISHLSCWSAGWSWGATGAYGTCGSTLSVTINTSDPTFKGGPYNVSLQAPDGTYLGGVQGVTISNGNVVTLNSVPSIPQAKIVVSGGIPNISVQSALFDPCGAGSVAITVPVAANTVNVSVNITGICNGKDLTILPSATFELYQQSGSTYIDAGTLQLVNGQGTTGLQAGQLYYLTTTYGGTNYTTSPFSVSKNNFSVTSSGLNLSATYDAPSNTLSFTGTIPVNCN